jgi:hypothetical protein
MRLFPLAKILLQALRCRARVFILAFREIVQTGKVVDQVFGGAACTGMY